MARRQTPYYHKLVALGAQFVERLDFDVALRVTSTEAEHLATRSNVGIFDVMYQGVIQVAGRDAMAVLQHLTVNDMRRLSDGSGLYSSMVDDQGRMVDDLTVFRHDAETYWICPTPSRTDFIASWIAEHVGTNCTTVTNITSGTAYLSVQGPKSRATLQKLTESDITGAALPYFGVKRLDIAGVPTVLARAGYSGELGFELFYARDYAEFLWDAVIGAGEEFGMAVCGLACLSSLGLEKKFLLYGRDLDPSTSPWEADLAWTVRLDKGDFLGRDALIEHRQSSLRRLLVGIAFDGVTFVPKAGATVSVEGREVGRVTAAGVGYTVGTSLALAFVEPRFGDEGSRVTVEDGAVEADGVVSRKAFYDPDRTRVRS